ncbi:hypothetical protein [Actinoplanes sp. NBRC 101535]|uniref:hypothetical protein n=1 Tax=Actinoplanes sp. NBRC 101535 TaxID=3032196 RepID=UPI0024A0B341|nr:hypothetical protein [Actinoplanes sp. NBRC 101535]GLY07206.1 hypothetical protein Acsp01_75850 [Actinoplanes sp. NBRC 101535]
MTPQATAIESDEEVQVLRPSPADWTTFVQQELAALGIDMAELRRQAQERDFASAAARELWVMVGDSTS